MEHSIVTSTESWYISRVNHISTSICSYYSMNGSSLPEERLYTNHWQYPRCFLFIGTSCFSYMARKVSILVEKLLSLPSTGRASSSWINKQCCISVHVATCKWISCGVIIYTWSLSTAWRQLSSTYVSTFIQIDRLHACFTITCYFILPLHILKYSK